MVEFIVGGIQVQYACTVSPWRKVLGFTFDIDRERKTVTMSCLPVIKKMGEDFLKGQLSYDAKLPGRDMVLEAGEIPQVGHPDRDAYLQMQTETRSILGLLLWVSLAYPQISFDVNRGCGYMSNPSWSVNKYAKGIVMHLVQHPVPVKWGGNKELKNLVLAQPTVKPFTDGAKEYGLHYAADASPSDVPKGITGGVGMLNGGAIDVFSGRQHLATPDTHSTEVLAAGTIMHRLVPVRGVLQEARIPQELGTPIYLDSASTVFVASNRAAPKKSAWIRRRSEVLVESFELGEVDPLAIDDIDNFSDPYTKRLTFKRWFRHLHYTHNLIGDAPAREDIASNKASKLQ